MARRNLGREVSRAWCSRSAAAVALVSLASCAPAPPKASAVTVLSGEITLHEFVGWTHAWAVFLDPGVPVASVRDTEILSLPPTPSTHVGACEIWHRPTCNDCRDGTFCQADGVCTAYPVRSYADVGPIDVSGGHGPMTMSFAPRSQLYESTPPPGPAYLFDGGESLEVAFQDQRVTLAAPQFLSLQSPSLTPFRIPAQGDLSFAWSAGDAELIEIFVDASSSVDYMQATSLRCLGNDGGTFTIPAAVLAELPPPPRTTHLEVTRNVDRIVPLGGDRGVLIHAGFTVAADGADQ